MTVPDGLRAIAALLVILPHSTLLFVFWPSPSRLTRQYLALCSMGAGARVFFVISGFVVAYSFKKNDRTVDSVKLFIVKRIIRLTPPYWCGIALMLLYHGLNRVVSTHPKPVPTMAQILCNMIYVQDFVGVDHVDPVTWTLCIEVQLYIVFCCLIVLHERIFRINLFPRRINLPLVVAISGGLGLLWPLNLLTSPRGLFVSQWYAFAVGASVWWGIERKMSLAVVVILLSMTYCVALVRSSFPTGSVVVAASFLLASGIFGKLHFWLSARSVQALATISYSLYLVHFVVIFLLMTVLRRLDPVNEGLGYLFVAAAYIISVAMALGFYRLVELPSLLASRKVRREHIKYAFWHNKLFGVRKDCA